MYFINDHLPKLIIAYFASRFYCFFHIHNYNNLITSTFSPFLVPWTDHSKIILNNSIKSGHFFFILTLMGISHCDTNE